MTEKPFEMGSRPQLTSGEDLTRRDIGRLGAGVSAVVLAATLGTPGLALAQAKRGGSINVATVGEPPTLDPMDSPADVVGMIAQHIFETLYTWGEGWRIVPLLAARDPEISADGKVYTIALRTGVKFHDGSVMTSADVLASLERWLANAARGKQTKPFVEGLTAPDANTVRIALKQPYAPLMSFLSLQTSAAVIMPRGNQAFPMTTPIGTGPFRFVERAPDRYVQLRRFDDYTARDEAANGYGGKRTPWLDEIRFVPVPDASTRVQGAIAGQFDYADVLPVESMESLRTAKSDPLLFKSFGWPFLFLNAKQGPLTNVKLRQAVLASLSFEDILAGAFGSKDFYSADGAWYPQGFLFHSTAGADAYKQAGDSARAKKMVADAGYRSETIRILTSRQFDFHYKIAQVAAENMREAGLKVELVVVDWATLLTRRNDAALYEIFITHGPILPEPTLFGFMNSGSAGWWATPARDASINAFNAEANPTKRAALWGDVQKAIYDEVPVVRIGNFSALAAKSKRLSGASPAVWPFFWNTWVDG
jgi:peptide/nickel transport system substrate-binding protein